MSDDFNKDGLPPWLWDEEPEDDQQATEDGAPAEPADAFDPLSDAAWPDDNDDASEPEKPSTADLPDWLQAAHEAPAEDDEALPWSSGAEDSPTSEPGLGEMPPDDFLALADSLPQTSDPEMTFDEWAVEQERLKRGPDLEAETPDLLSDIDQSLDSVKPTGELPDWYLGLDALDESDVPEWLTADADDTPASPPAEPADVPAWLEGMEEPPPAPTPATGEFDDDFFAALGLPQDAPDEADEPPAAALAGEPDFSWLDDPTVKATSDRLREDAREDDFFAAMTGPPQEPAPPPFEPTDEADVPAEPPTADDIDERTAAGLMADRDGDLDMSWLNDMAGDEPQAATAPPPEQTLEDFFAHLDAEAPATEPPPEKAASGWDDDTLAGTGELTDMGAFETDDALAEPEFLWDDEQPAGAAELPDSGAFETGDTPAEAELPWGAAPQPEPADPFTDFDFDMPATDDAEPDWLGALDTIAPQPRVPAPPEETDRPPSTGELDDFLAALDSDVSSTLPQSDPLEDQTDFDFDMLLEEPPLPTPGRHDRPEPDELAQAAPDFLRDLNVSQKSATAVVRQLEDRPLDALPERLRRLHERGEDQRASAPTAPTDSDVLARVLPDVAETIAPVAIAAGLPALPDALTLSESEREKVGILEGLLAREDSAFALPGEMSDPADRARKMPAAAGVRARTRRRYPLDRLLIALLLVAATAAPFFIEDLRLGDLPPARFEAGSAGALAFERVDRLNRGALALVAIEYGPSAAAELDPMLTALVRHLLLQGARPVLVGGNPVGLLHAANQIEALGRDTAFMAQLGREGLAANRDYYVVRYLTGSMVGVRAFGEAAGSFMLNDIRGQTTNLRVNSLADFGLIVVVAERGDDARNYVEQIAPLAAAPLVLATGYSAGPVVEPYASTAGASGLLVGYQDAYTYLAMLDAGAAGESGPPAPSLFDIARFAQQYMEMQRTQAALPAITDEPTAGPTEPAASVTAGPTGTAMSTATTVPSRTPTLTSTPTLTPTATPTATPSATATPSPTPTLTRTPRPAQPGDVIGTVRSQQSVNVRSGPGTDFRVVGGLHSGTEVLVIGRTATRTWYQVELSDGTVGWVSAQLLFFEGTLGADDVPLADTGASKRQPLLKPAAQDTDGETEATEAPKPTRRSSSQRAPVQTQTTPEASAAARDVLPYGSERWYAMTLGIIGSVTVIGIGAAVNIARAIARRRGR